MRNIIIRLAIYAVALFATIALLRGAYIVPQSTDWLGFIWLAIIFAAVNAVLRPILVVLSCPLLILTLGLGMLLINTLLFALAGWIGAQFGVGFEVNGFLGAFLGSLVFSVISFVLGVLLRVDRKDNR